MRLLRFPEPSVDQKHQGGNSYEKKHIYHIDIGSASTDCNLRVWYEYDKETNGPGPSTIIAVKD